MKKKKRKISDKELKEALEGMVLNAVYLGIILTVLNFKKEVLERLNDEQKD